MKHCLTTALVSSAIVLSLVGCSHQQEPAAQSAPAAATPEHPATDTSPPSASAKPGKTPPASTTRPVEPPVSEPATPSPTLPPGDSLVDSRHVPLGIPTDDDPSDDYLLNREQWVASYNPSRLVPNWVAWQLVAPDLGSLKRPKPEPFADDTTLPSTMPHVGPRDYAGSGYDRGHMCPSADRSTTKEVNKVTYLMTNMQPQLHDLNGFPWKGLEDFERSLALGGKQLAIIAGGIFANSAEKIGNKQIAVPTANFKIIVVMESGQKPEDITKDTKVYAVIMPNAKGITKKKWSEYLVSVDKIERETGYDFLSDVPKDVQAVIEARVEEGP